jgi:hypothetical protein
MSFCSAITPDDKTIKNNCREYWDGGSAKIQEFLDDHREGCQNNWVCHKLGLDSVLVHPNSPKKDLPASKKQKLSFILDPTSDSE